MSTATVNQFPFLELRGAPYEIGYQHGARFKDQIRHSLATFTALLNESGSTAVAYASRSIPYCRKHAPELLEEVQGIADGSGWSAEEIFTLNASLDLYGSRQRRDRLATTDCWAAAFGGDVTDHGGTYVTWTAEDNERWLPSCVLLKIIPADAPPCLTWTFAGFVGRPGLNPRLALSAVCLVTDDTGDGMPYPFLCRQILAVESVDQAIATIASVDRMSGMDYTVGDADGQVATIETTARAHRVARGSGGWVACTGVTNDDGAANLSTLSPWPGSSVQTARLGRLQELRAGKPDRIGLADLQQWQRDHNQGGLCAHAGTGFGLPCLCAFICDVPAGRMWLTHGSPCRAEYVPMDLQPATVPGRAKGRR